MAKKHKRPRSTVLDVINDAYMNVDGEVSPVEKDTHQFERGIRFLNKIAYEVTTFNDWSFLRGFFQAHTMCDTPVDGLYHITRVFDTKGNQFTRVDNSVGTPRYYEYMVAGDVFYCGDVYTPNKMVTVEYQEYVGDFITGDERIHPKLYDVLVLGLASELAESDDGYRAAAANIYQKYRSLLSTTAKRDKTEAGNAVDWG